jgi:hypothetical protein
MKSNFTQAEAIPGLMGGTANKDSERYKRRGGLHTPNAQDQRREAAECIHQESLPPATGS